MKHEKSVYQSVIENVFQSSIDGIISNFLIESLNNICLNQTHIDKNIIHNFLSPYIKEILKINDADAIAKICEDVLIELKLYHNNMSIHSSLSTSDKVSNVNTCFEPIKNTFDMNSHFKDFSQSFDDPYFILKKRSSLLNCGVDAGTENTKLIPSDDKKKKKRLLKEWDRNRLNLPTPVKSSGLDNTPKSDSIIVDSFSISVTGKELLKNATLKISIGKKYGLIGRNGIGKSTFLACLARHEIVGVHPGYNIAYAEQELNEELLNNLVLDSVLDVHVERKQLLVDELHFNSLPKSDENDAALCRIYQRLDEINSDAVKAEAIDILIGLGFTVPMFSKKICELSGGWRMRIALARALFASSDILCLDEPTNHLDLHAVEWLIQFIKDYPKTCLIVSHARFFLNEVCTSIIDFTDNTLVYYNGNYDLYESVKEAHNKTQAREFENQQRKISHIKKFIDKFRYNAATASLAQSRIKALEKLPILQESKIDPSIHFQFYNANTTDQSLIQITDAWFTYKDIDDPLCESSDDHWILKNVSLSISTSSRIAICGLNGSGKSTLLKLIVGSQLPSKGTVSSATKVSIGYFTQYHIDQLDLTLNAVEQLQKNFREHNISDEDARTYLGRFGITGLLSLEPLYILSGGQKNRVVIALIAYTNPQLLVLDEPTNHLDLDAIQALIVALNEYNGGIVIVSHDFHLLSCVVDEIYYVDSKKRSLIRYSKDIESYRKDCLTKKI